MRDWLRVLLLALSASFASASEIPARSPDTYAAVADRASRSVVTVFSRRDGMKASERARIFGDSMKSPLRQEGLGSGVIISASGFILTNFHVVDEVEDVSVTLAGSDDHLPATVVGGDEKSDLAVLKIEPGAIALAPISYADSSQVTVGDVVLAVGNPFGVGQSITMGIISAVGRGVGILDYEDFLQTDASINPGNSGGPLLNTAGQLVGINTAIISRTGGSMGIGFAVPANYARAVADSIISNGRVVRGYLGVAAQRLSPPIAAALGLADSSGVLIADVVPNSPADLAGLKAGDLIIAIDGATVADPRQLRLRISGTNPGANVAVLIKRQNAARIVRATVGDLADTEAPAPLPAPPASEKPESKALGIHVQDLDDVAREHLSVPERIKGGLVIEALPGSRAWDAGLRPGDVILQVNGGDVGTAGEAAKEIRKVAEGPLLLRIWNRMNGSRFVAITQGLNQDVAEDEKKQRIE